tara:strand:+ start:490 stop:642 length:153 start_codon:yes stop_codon:yes gene_type:complete
MNDTEKSLQDLKKMWNIGNKSTEFEWVFMTKEEKEYFKKCCELMYKKTKK